MKVLVTGAGALLGQGIIRSLRASTLTAKVLAVDPDPRAAGLYWADRAALVPLASSSEYGSAIRDILLRERPDAVLVGTDVELKYFARERGALEAEFGTHILVSSPAVIETADDKWKTYLFLREFGLDCPASTLDPNDELFLRTASFPLVVKPRRGARSVGVRFVETVDQLTDAVRGVQDPIIQECAGPAAEEYTAGALVFDGECTASIVMRRDLRDGNTYRAYVEEYPELNAGVRRIAECLGSQGPVNLQFRVDHGQIKVFEINARFSGTTPIRMHAGFNEVELCLRRVVLGQEVRQPAVRPVVVLRHWEETLVEWPRLVEMSRGLDVPVTQQAEYSAC